MKFDVGNAVYKIDENKKIFKTYLKKSGFFVMIKFIEADLNLNQLNIILK